ncbi:hypothetical protein QZH41_002160 [Actinostola sp. cb2023]|nr:hypothetical protein QZH41_002160 [Actinostola sp. cb2023]
MAQPQQGYGYPPPVENVGGTQPPGYGAPQPGYPPPQGQGYPPPQQGYPPPQQQPGYAPAQPGYAPPVAQQPGYAAAFTGFETNNKYKIKNNLGQQIYFAAEGGGQFAPQTDCVIRYEHISK